MSSQPLLLLLLLSVPRRTAPFGSLQSRAAALYASWAQHTPVLPDRRLSTLDASDWRALCGKWWEEYVQRHRERTPCTQLGEGGCHVVGPTTGSHGIGDWQMDLLGQLFRNVGSALVIAWPELMEHSMGGAGLVNATAPLGWEQLPSTAGGAAARGPAPPEWSVLRDACALEVVLRPSEALLDTIREPLHALLDPDALTIGIHIRTGAADVRGDCGGELEECADSKEMSEADEAPLVRQAVRCAAALERRWLGSRARSVWLVASDSLTIRSRLAEALAAAELPPRPRQLLAANGAASGLHTGVVYQAASEATALGNYSEVLRAAYADQLLLAHTDLIVAVSNGAVTSLSAFARAAGTRAAKHGSLVHLKLDDERAGAADECQPSPWPWDR